MAGTGKVETSRYDAADMVYEGCFSGLPEKESSVVRVFLSSTFTDMQCERNWLMKYAIPYLRDFCQQQGLEFQIADMRWGVREDSVDDHKTTEVCLHEIKACQRLSKGPYFVAFLGDKYGYRPFPSEIDAVEFKLLKNTAKKLGYDISLLLAWYQCDHNREPTVYTLQPITSMYPCYFDMSPSSTAARSQAQREWGNVVTQLTMLLRGSAYQLYKEGKITEEQKHKYFQSVTENEVHTGILSTDNVDNVLCFERTLIDINMKDAVAGRFTDLIDGCLDTEAEELRERLRMVKLPAKLSSNQLFRYNIPWDSIGINLYRNEEHIRYMTQFGKDFIDNMEKMILSGCQDTKKQKSALFEEVLHQLHFALIKCKTFCGRENILENIKQYLSVVHVADTAMDVDAKDDDKNVEEEDEDDDERSDETKTKDEMRQDESGMIKNHLKTLGVTYTLGDEFNEHDSDPNFQIKDQLTKLPVLKSYTKPLIIYGKSGCGKTASMAKVALLSKEWLPGCVTMLRFLGTSTMSTKIREVLVSLCMQIWQVYKIHKPTGLDLESDFQFLVHYFIALLWQIDTDNRTLVIILDSVDQLSPSDHAHMFTWLPHKLPPGVHIILSVVSDRLNCLENLRLMFPSSDQYIEIGSLEDKVAVDVINVFCKQSNRHLSKAQKNLVLDLFSKCNQPLYLRLLMDMSLSWKSYTVLEHGALGFTVREAINHLFDGLERIHGEELVKKGIGYMCAAREGLTSTEIEDLLSLDDQVLQDTYIYHLPPDPDVIRLPPLLWKRVEYDISEYVVERQSGGKNVITWYHRQFTEVTKERYLTDKVKQQFHLGLAEYFQGVWSDKPKPLQLTKGKKGSYPNAFRQVPAQPIRFGPNLYNTRKLSELPYQLIQSNHFQRVLADHFCNPDWLYAKCCTMTLTSIMEDFHHAEKQCMENLTQKRAHLDAEKMMGKIVDASEVSMLKILEEVLQGIKNVSRMVLLASESTRKDPINLPVMLLSQLGPDYRGNVYLEKLMQQCERWCDVCPMPLLVPTRDCMMKQGGNMLYSIDVDVAIIGDKRDDNYHGVHLREDTSQLLVIKQKSTKFDELCVFDLKDNGSCMSVENMGKYIRSVKLVGNNKYLWLDTYIVKDQYDPVSEHKLYESTISTPVTFDHKPQLISVSKSGKMIVCAFGNKLHVYKKEKHLQLTYSAQCHEKDIATVIVSPDETLLVSSDISDKCWFNQKAGMSAVHDLKSKKQIHVIDESLNIGSFCLITAKNVLVTSKSGYKERGTLVMYDLVAGRSMMEVKVNETYDVKCLQLHSSEEFVFLYYNSTSVINGIQNKYAELVEITTGKRFGKCPEEYKDSCSSATVFGSDNLYYALCNWNKDVVPILYAGEVKRPLQDAVIIHVLIGHNQPIREIVTPRSLDFMLTVGDDNTIKVWDLKSILGHFHTEISKLETSMIQSTFNQAMPQIELNITEGLPEIDLAQVVSRYHPAAADVKPETNVLAFNRHGDSLYVGTKSGKLLCFDVQTNEKILTSNLDIGAIRIMQLSSNGQYMIVAGKDTIHVEALLSQKTIDCKHRGAISCIAENNNILVAGSAGMEAKGRVWDIQTGEVIKDFELLYSFYCVGISKDGTKVVSSFFDFPVVVDLINPEEGSNINPENMDTMMSSAVCCVISADDQYAAMSSSDGAVRVINLAGKYIYRLQQRSSAVALTFSPDNKNILSAGYRSIYIWSLYDGSCRYKLTRHADFVNCIKFSETGQFMVTVSKDKQVVLWDFHRRVSIATFPANCQINAVDMTTNAGSVAYIPQGIADLAVLKANKALEKVMSGRHEMIHLTPQVKALVMAFSGQSAKKSKRSQTCSLM